MRFDDAIPIWMVFLITIILVMMSMEIGHRQGHAMRRRSHIEGLSLAK
jgi:hypothetical protein